MCEFERTGISERMEDSDYLSPLTLHCVGFGGMRVLGDRRAAVSGLRVVLPLLHMAGLSYRLGHVSEVVVFICRFLRTIPSQKTELMKASSFSRTDKVYGCSVLGYGLRDHRRVE